MSQWTDGQETVNEKYEEPREAKWVDYSPKDTTKRFRAVLEFDCPEAGIALLQRELDGDTLKGIFEGLSVPVKLKKMYMQRKDN
mgnify:CR=1 FL=1